MKKRNILFASMAVILGLGIFSGFDNNYYQKENDERRTELTSIKENADDLTREFIEKLESKERSNGIEYWETKSEDGSVDYISISGCDQENDIDIDGRLKNNYLNVFISKGDDRTWIDTQTNLYHSDNRSDYDIPTISTTNELSFGEESVLRALDNYNKVEKTDFGYKVTISDDLNYGYSLYDENGDLFQTYLDNSQGKVTSKLLETDEDVLDVYERYMSLTSEMTYTDNIADIKEAAN
ncbi:hypothetical protein [Anaerococcus sp. Marseille-Q7828]|uniref:hypothetical protein n=1 Tax=Anaerococcus sp. Marseille-Q7828 TaxID=3036300 RepID=UPI0024AD1E21|nr:hypothetical protein [Anaerococcus sp. Marseille-Q7828]